MYAVGAGPYCHKNGSNNLVETWYNKVFCTKYLIGLGTKLLCLAKLPIPSVRNGKSKLLVRRYFTGHGEIDYCHICRATNDAQYLNVSNKINVKLCIVFNILELNLCAYAFVCYFA